MEEVVIFIFAVMFLVIIGIAIYHIHDYIKYQENVKTSFVEITNDFNTALDDVNVNFKNIGSNIDTNIDTLKKEDTKINGKISIISSNLDEYFSFSDTKNWNTYLNQKTYENVLGAIKPDLQLLSHLSTINGITMRTSDKLISDGNFKLCNDNNDCINMNVNSQGFNITPENNTNNLIINSKKNKALMKMDLENDRIYFGGEDVNSPMFIQGSNLYINNVNMVLKSQDQKVDNDYIKNDNNLTGIQGYQTKVFYDFLQSDDFKSNAKKITEAIQREYNLQKNKINQLDNMNNTVNNIQRQMNNTNTNINTNINQLQNQIKQINDTNANTSTTIKTLSNSISSIQNKISQLDNNNSIFIQNISQQLQQHRNNHGALIKYPIYPMISEKTSMIVPMINSTSMGEIFVRAKATSIISAYGPTWALFNHNKTDEGAKSYHTYTNYNPVATKTYFPNYAGEAILIDLGKQIILKQIAFYPRGSFKERCPGVFRIYATNDVNKFNMNDYSGWAVIHDQKTRITTYTEGVPFLVNINNNTPYSIYALVVNTVSGNSNVLNFAEWELYGANTV